MKIVQVIKKGQFWAVFFNSELEGLWESEDLANKHADQIYPDRKKD